MYVILRFKQIFECPLISMIVCVFEVKVYDYENSVFWLKHLHLWHGENGSEDIFTSEGK